MNNPRNLITGKLTNEEPREAYSKLKKTNNFTVIRSFQETLTNLFLPNSVPTDKVILLLDVRAEFKGYFKKI